MGLLRYAPAMLLFAPVWLRFGLKPARIAWGHAAIVGLCGGFLFVTLLATGLRFAPVADSAVFAPAVLPVFVALLSFILLGERFGALRLLGFALILGGALAIGGVEALGHAGDGSWRGHLLFLGASFLWALYTVVFRRSGMTAIEAGAVMALWSTIGFVLLALATGVGFEGQPPGFLALQAVLQGVLSGFLATFTYGYALLRLGTSRTAAFAALVPPLAALGGLVFLGEPIDLWKGLGIAVATAGVLLASGVVSRGPRVPRQEGT